MTSRRQLFLKAAMDGRSVLFLEQGGESGRAGPDPASGSAFSGRVGSFED